MGVALNHPFAKGFSIGKPSSYWGTPIYGNPHRTKPETIAWKWIPCLIPRDLDQTPSIKSTQQTYDLYIIHIMGMYYVYINVDKYMYIYIYTYI